MAQEISLSNALVTVKKKSRDPVTVASVFPSAPGVAADRLRFEVATALMVPETLP